MTFSCTIVLQVILSTLTIAILAPAFVLLARAAGLWTVASTASLWKTFTLNRDFKQWQCSQVARLDGGMWKIARLTPVYLWFWACCRAAWQTGQQRSERALNHKKTTKSQKDYKNLSFARLFARLTLVFLSKKRPSVARLFTKMSPSKELGTLHSLCICLCHGKNIWPPDPQTFSGLKKNLGTLPKN